MRKVGVSVGEHMEIKARTAHFDAQIVKGVKAYLQGDFEAARSILEISSTAVGNRQVLEAIRKLEQRAAK